MFVVQKTPVSVGDWKGSCHSLDLLDRHIPTSTGVYIETEARHSEEQVPVLSFPGAGSLVFKWWTDTGVETTRFQESSGSGLHSHKYIFGWACTLSP